MEEKYKSNKKKVGYNLRMTKYFLNKDELLEEQMIKMHIWS